MNDRIEQFTENLKQRISRMEHQLEDLNSDIHADLGNDSKSLQAKLKNAALLAGELQKKTKAENSENPKVLKAHQKNGVAADQGWKREIKKSKLDNHAARSEDNAQSAISMAESRVAEAIVATYEALAARMASNENSQRPH